MRAAAAALATIALGLGACEGESEQETTERESGLACDHFRNVAADASAGILTDAELRDKLKEVNDDAIIATPEVQAAATEMLASITASDPDRLASAVDEMDSACSATGN